VASSDLITSAFSRYSTTEDVIAGIDLSGHRAVVAGASSGIGEQTARALASAGAQMALAMRNVKAGRRVTASIQEQTGNSDLAVEQNGYGRVPRGCGYA
jgi:NAD(P)-dependent dehydrogenase (short-subunit alcohol dehydrogenase family)